MRFAILALALASTFGLFRCSSGGPPPPTTFAVGAYEYTGLDSSGKKVVAGTLNLTEIKDKSIKGTWELKQVADGSKLGPQTGSGDFSGESGPDGININLNPNTADNNVFLNGKFENGELRGTWTYSTFVGPTTKGTFTAKKK